VLAARSQPVATIGPTTDRVSARFAPPRAGGLGRWPAWRTPLTSPGDLGAERRRAAPCVPRGRPPGELGGHLRRPPRPPAANEPAGPRTRPRNPGIRTPVVLRGILEIRGRSDRRRGTGTDGIHAWTAAPDRLRTGPERVLGPGSSAVRTSCVSRNDASRRDGSRCRGDDPDYADTSAGADVCRGRLRRGRRAGAATRRRSAAGCLGRQPPVPRAVRSMS